MTCVFSIITGIQFLSPCHSWPDESYRLKQHKVHLHTLKDSPFRGDIFQKYSLFKQNRKFNLYQIYQTKKVQPTTRAAAAATEGFGHGLHIFNLYLRAV